MINAALWVTVIEKGIVAKLKAGDLAEKGSASALGSAKNDRVSFL